MDYFAKEFYDFKDDIVIAESQILKVSERLDRPSGCKHPLTGHLAASRLQRHRAESIRQHCQLPSSAHPDRPPDNTADSLVVCE